MLLALGLASSLPGPGSRAPRLVRGLVMGGPRFGDCWWVAGGCYGRWQTCLAVGDGVSGVQAATVESAQLIMMASVSGAVVDSARSCPVFGMTATFRCAAGE